MKIIADQEIKWLSELFSSKAEIIALPSDKITRDALLFHNADILLVRSVSQVDADLLQGSSLQFIGSATAGLDHVDVDYLQQQGIAFSYAPGANAQAVVEYIMACLASLFQQNFFKRKIPTIGIVGVGNIGGLLLEALGILGWPCTCYDPLRPLRDADFISCDFSELYNCDVISLHTPLTTTGDFATRHMINENVLAQFKPGAIILNTARGAVVDNSALLANKNIYSCLDVWENEPHINLSLLAHTIIATPHIAGHAREAKINATKLLYQGMAKKFDWPPLDFSVKNKTASFWQWLTQTDWHTRILAHYNPGTDTVRMKKLLLQRYTSADCAEVFKKIRNHYSLR